MVVRSTEERNSLQSVSTSGLDLSTVLASPYPNGFSFHSILERHKEICISIMKKDSQIKLHIIHYKRVYYDLISVLKIS